MTKTAVKTAEPADEPRRGRKGEHTSDRILDAAETLFAEDGYEGTTLRDVAAAVGIRTPSLYNHFESKEALYSAVLERGLHPVMSLLEDFAASRPGNRTDSSIVEGIMEILSQRPDIARLIQHETLAGGRRLTGMLRAWIQPLFERSAEMVIDSPAPVSWPPEQVPLLILALYHVIVGFFTMAPLYKEMMDEDLLSEEGRALQTVFVRELVDRLFVDPDLLNKDLGTR